MKKRRQMLCRYCFLWARVHLHTPLLPLFLCQRLVTMNNKTFAIDLQVYKHWTFMNMLNMAFSQQTLFFWQVLILYRWKPVEGVNSLGFDSEHVKIIMGGSGGILFLEGHPSCETIISVDHNSHLLLTVNLLLHRSSCPPGNTWKTMMQRFTMMMISTNNYCVNWLRERQLMLMTQWPWAGDPQMLNCFASYWLTLLLRSNKNGLWLLYFSLVFCIAKQCNLTFQTMVGSAKAEDQNKEKSWHQG